MTDISFETEEGYTKAMDMDGQEFRGIPLEIAPPTPPISYADTRLLYLQDCTSLVTKSITKALNKGNLRDSVRPTTFRFLSRERLLPSACLGTKERNF